MNYVNTPEIELFYEVKSSDRFTIDVLKFYPLKDITDFLKQYFPRPGVNYEWTALMIKSQC